MDNFVSKDKAKLADNDCQSESSENSNQTYFYDSKRGELLGRTISSWFKLILFYLLFCAILALLWGLCMGVFFQTLDFYIPKYKNDEGLLGTNPGLGFRPAGGLGFQNQQYCNTSQHARLRDTGARETAGGPTDAECLKSGNNMVDSPASKYSSLIWFKHGAGGNWQQLKANLDAFLEHYEPGYFANQGASLTKCDFETNPLTSNPFDHAAKDKSCEFNKEWLSDQGSDYKCITQEDYGYRHGKPCILLKMNKIYDWRPNPYTMDEITNHTTMPLKLKSDISAIWDAKCGGYPTSGWGDDGSYRPCPWLNMVWLHCDGEDDPDKENIGPVSYTPFRGFPGYFYPYRNQRGYLSPIVMVQLKKPVPGVIMNIECTAWARNIDHNRMKRRGLTHFELIMD